MLPTERISYSAITQRPEVEIAGRRPHGGVGDRECGRMGSRATDAAHGADAARRRFAQPRYPELGLARIRQPRRLLAPSQGIRRFQAAGRACDQRLCDPGLPRDHGSGHRTQLGVHGPRLHPAQHAEGGERARGHQEDQRCDRKGDRQAAARLARPGPDRDLGNARYPRRRGLRLCLRLGARRSAGLAEDAHQADRQHPLHPGMQRRRDDADPASQGVGILRSRDRSVRADLRGRSGLRARSWRS